MRLGNLELWVLRAPEQRSRLRSHWTRPSRRSLEKRRGIVGSLNEERRVLVGQRSCKPKSKEGTGRPKEGRKGSGGRDERTQRKGLERIQHAPHITLYTDEKEEAKFALSSKRTGIRLRLRLNQIEGAAHSNSVDSDIDIHLRSVFVRAVQLVKSPILT